jgi:hypothetical protein
LYDLQDGRRLVKKQRNKDRQTEKGKRRSKKTRRMNYIKKEKGVEWKKNRKRERTVM